MLTATNYKYRNLTTSKVACFISVDPLQFKYAYYTPYQYAGNKPVSFIDLDGAEPKLPTDHPWRWKYTYYSSVAGEISEDENGQEWIGSYSDEGSWEQIHKLEPVVIEAKQPENNWQCGYEQELIIFGWNTGLTDDSQLLNEISLNVEVLGKIGPLYGLARESLYSSKNTQEAGHRGFLAVGLISDDPYKIQADLAYIQTQRAFGRDIHDILKNDWPVFLAFSSLVNEIKVSGNAGVFVDSRKVFDPGGSVITLMDVIDGDADMPTVWYENNITIQQPGKGAKFTLYQITNSEGANFVGLRSGAYISTGKTEDNFIGGYTATPFVIFDAYNSNK